jgi:hypothetical protein
MKVLTNISYYIGKFWLAIILFLAMIISTVISLPFIVVGKVMDFLNADKIKAGSGQYSDFYG